MTQEELQTLRLMMREEIGSSEQRVGQRLDRIEGRMDQMGTIQRDLRDDMVQVKLEMVDIKTEQKEVISVLKEAVRVASEAQTDQRALEIKVDENLQTFKRTLQLQIEGMQKFVRDFVEMNRLTNERLTYHENSPASETHPRPPQPGTAA